MFIFNKISLKNTLIPIINRLFIISNKNIFHNFTFGLNFSTRYHGSADGTFQARILKYFQTNHKNTNFASNKTYEILNNAKNTSRSQLLKQLEQVDQFHLKNYNNYSISDIFAVLSNIMLVTPAEVTKLKIYKTLDQIDFNKLSQNEKIEYIFYLSLDKKKKNQLTTCINYLNFQNDFNIEDLAILCASTFKTSTKFKKNFIFNQINSIFLNDKEIYQDPSLLITFIKSIRQNNYYNKTILIKISENFLNDNIINKYNFTGLSHILALFANFSFFQREFLIKISEKCIEEMKNQIVIKSKTEHFTKQIRAKDISRFLWALSYLGFDECNSYLEGVVLSQILQRIELGEFKADELIDTILSLWVLNIKSEELIHKSLTKQNITMIQDSPLSKDKARLYLLLTCIQLEADNYIDINSYHLTNIKPKITFPNYYRKSVRKVRDILADLTKKFKNVEIKHWHQVPNINIDGISIYYDNKKILDIEVLDEFVCLKNLSESVPYGLMKLKLRLLNNEANTKIEKIPKKIIDDDTNLQIYLQKLLYSQINME